MQDARNNRSWRAKYKRPPTKVAFFIWFVLRMKTPPFDKFAGSKFERRRNDDGPERVECRMHGIIAHGAPNTKGHLIRWPFSFGLY